ncbi:MAG: hypothetical protein JXB42_04050, partial [Deltaproteobacteria bacterium]|nr:hypothetical protein [Deltaproteobacteria bacterium]
IVRITGVFTNNQILTGICLIKGLKTGFIGNNYVKGKAVSNFNLFIKKCDRLSLRLIRVY